MAKMKKAAALRYHQGKEEAPRVIASGQGYLASKILEIAGEKDIPVYEDASLAEQLSALSVGEEIPFELYEAVASVLAFIARMDGQKE